MNATRERTAVHVRWMLRRDFWQVLQIEFGSFDYPWGLADFIRCLRQRNCLGMTAVEQDDDKLVAGFMVYEHFADRIELLNFAVAGDYRRRGVGRRMIEKLKLKLSPRRGFGWRRRLLTADVWERNLEAQLFFRAMGFRSQAIVRKKYEIGEDAYRFVYETGG